MTDLSNRKPFCTIVDNKNIVVVVFGNELNELSDNAMDAGDPFWYIMGTDAWFELQEIGGQPLLAACTYDKTYFHCPVDEQAIALLQEESGVLVLFPQVPLNAADIKQTSDLEEMREWISHEIGEDKMDGLIYCFYTAEDKKKYHGDN
ncbi:hypothetical protein [Chitinophaga varians]|uniref:hypothetical protein n=1 Tax=Chitinophaga varians TaxID=2202339 RepID=UPI00165EECD2|nr:hypothetical protein [Chitinophaga varians]MBC9915191.1 hypothetical protein [Chitinophaga varians]